MAAYDDQTCHISRHVICPDALLAGLRPGGRGVHRVLPPLGGRAAPLPRLWQHLRQSSSQVQRLNLHGNGKQNYHVHLYCSVHKYK